MIKAIVTKDTGNGNYPDTGTNNHIVTKSLKRESTVIKHALNFTKGRCYCRIQFFTEHAFTYYGKPYKTIYIW